MIENCSCCGEEVRFGKRGNLSGWLHRVDVDHAVTLGRIQTHEDVAEIRRQYRDVIRHYDDGTPYTTAEHDIARDKDVVRRRKRMAELKGTPLQTAIEIPPVEVLAHDVGPDTFAPRSGIRQVLNLIFKQGWELISCRHSRGPYLGSDGSVLSISDAHVVKARQPTGLDGATKIAVASWRSGSFDFAYIGTIQGGRLNPVKVDATTMKNWIKGIE